MKKWKYYKKIFAYFKEKKFLIFIYLLTSLGITGINMLDPLISAKNLEAITQINFRNMLIFSFLLVVCRLIANLISYLNKVSSSKIQDDVELKIKEDISKELFNLEIKNFDQKGTGFFAERVNSEASSLAGIFTYLRYNLVGFLSSLGVLIYIFYLNIYLGLYFLIFSFVFFYLNIRRTKRWEVERKTSNEMYEKYSSNFNELIRGIKDIKVLNLKEALIKKTLKDQRAIKKYNYESRMRDEKHWFLEDILRSLYELFFIILCIILIKNGLLNGANMLVLYMYRGRATDLVNEIGGIYRNYKEVNISMERIYEVIGGEKYPKDQYGNVKITNVLGCLEFKNVCFGYDKNQVLKGINFKINVGETIGIVGKSGAGKTTIFNLINKLYTPEKGTILLDNININELTEDTIRENISTITQDPYIFNMSIKENLKIVNPQITDEEIKEKCKLCKLDDYINSLDHKYDTLVGENGVILSGGLKQRLAIARALVKNSKIIMLDEATSSLDNETQEHIHDSIRKIRKDYTILIIAHRLSTVIDCDKIMVIDKGKVVGFDTHDKLMKTNKVYQKLYQKELK